MTSPQIIISGFPGIGKSEIFKINAGKLPVHDSDSSLFSWITKTNNDGTVTKERNPDFPNNYLSHIRGLTGIVMVSSHVEVRELLEKNFIKYYLVYPSPDLKECYQKRYVDRGSPDAFVHLLMTNWDKWIMDLDNSVMSRSRCLRKAFKLVGCNTYLSNVLPDILRDSGYNP